MKLLFITQVVDKNDALLGAYHGWLAALASEFEKITAICLQEGEHELPNNIKVFSLGKERRAVSRSRYAWRFLQLVWQQRKEYDTVFVHMNQEYILLAGWLWKLWGKKIYLWRNHYSGSFVTDLAALFCTNVFCTSKFSYTARYKKTKIMPIGIDTTRFKPTPNNARMLHSILFLARMSPSKRPELLIEALGVLKKRGIEFTASLYGSPLPRDEMFYIKLKNRAHELGLDSQITFHAEVANTKTPEIYSNFSIFVNCSPSGMFDKTIFEAAACGTLPLVSSRDWAALAGEQLSFKEGSAQDLSEKLEALLVLSPGQSATLSDSLGVVVGQNSLATLVQKLSAALQEN